MPQSTYWSAPVGSVLRRRGRGGCARVGLGLNDDPSLTRDFFYEKYRLNNLIGTTNETTPQVSVWDGITMGGGSECCARKVSRVHGEGALTKPETGIGLFPDVGA